MFDIGFWEIVLIAVVALLVVGPDEFPGLVRNIGRGVGKVKTFLSSVKADLDYEIDKANEIKRLMEKEAELSELQRILEENSAQVPIQGKQAGSNNKVEQTDDIQAESDQKSAQPVADRQQTQ